MAMSNALLKKAYEALVSIELDLNSPKSIENFLLKTKALKEHIEKLESL